MYYIEKSFEVSACHHLILDHGSKCENIHGHNWQITVYCKAEELDNNGMVIDFTLIKQKIHGRLDHQNLNKVLSFNPTAENIAKWIVDEIPHCYKAKVAETANNVAIYEK